MADFTTYANGDVVALAGGANAASLPGFTVYENTYDGARGTVANGDVCTEFLKIPAGSMVLGVQVTVLTAEGTVTVDVGDGDDSDGFVAAQALAATGRFAGAGAYAGTSVYYDADTWLQFTAAAADLTSAVFKVSVAVANMG